MSLSISHLINFDTCRAVIQNLNTIFAGMEIEQIIESLKDNISNVIPIAYEYDSMYKCYGYLFIYENFLIFSWQGSVDRWLYEIIDTVTYKSVQKYIIDFDNSLYIILSKLEYRYKIETVFNYTTSCLTPTMQTDITRTLKVNKILNRC